ncbi:MAG: GNAT family N-acetyltransferase [Planctomycetaceae bacterium]
MVVANQNPLSRLRRRIQRYGLLPSIRRFVSRACNRTFRARLCVWVWRPGEPLADGPVEFPIRRYASAEQLPPAVLEELIAGDASSFESRMRQEFREGGALWVAFAGGRAAGYHWSRNGRFVENWHFELNENDVLIYSTVTFPEFAGRGIARAVMARICRDEVPAHGRALADCMVWNTPAVSFIAKTGFTKVAERKPLSHHPD